MKNKRVKNIAGFEILILVASLFAFCFIINESEIVSGLTPEQVEIEYQKEQAYLQGMRDSSRTPLGGGTTVTGFSNAIKLPTYTALKDTTLTFDNGVQAMLTKGTTLQGLEGGAAKAVIGGKELTIPADTLAGMTESGNIEVAKEATSAAKTPPGPFDAIMQDTLMGSLVWSLIIGGGVAMLAGFFGVSGDNQKALFVATFAGAMTYQILNPLLAGQQLTFFGQKFTWQAAASKAAEGGIFGASTPLVTLGLSVGVGLLILNMLWKKESKKLVSFQCIPYEPPVGGKYCELCNKDPMRPCSEYRCKSLGQACELLNAGTENEMCAWVNRQDVTSPTIIPFEDALTKDHSYKDVKTRPPGTGMKIVYNPASDGCIKAFTPLSFGISTNEPTQCKIDYNHTTTIRDVKQAYSSMAYYFGESSLYAYNHTQILRLPGATTVNGTGGVEIIHDGTFTLYVRCQDANGNVNEDEFAIRFCVEKGPDTTPPRIEGTSIPNGYPVFYGLNETDIEVYVNEPSDCRWSRQDRDYEQMENTMSCNRNVFDMNNNMVYTCRTVLNGLENRKDNEFYFRCKDQPNLELTDRKNDRNTNQESYKFILKGTQPINIIKTAPNGTIQGYADVVSVDLEVITSNGYNKGEAICYYSQTGNDADYIKMFEQKSANDGYHNRQNQQLSPGTYTYYFKCVDLGGNTDFNSTTFTVQVDRQAPVVVRVYNEGNNLKIVTDEKSSCSYSQTENQKCNFDIANGKAMLYANSTDHYTEWQPNLNYYIKCADSSGNQPNPVDCSIIARPYTSTGK